MLDIEGYQIDQKLHEGANSLIYRAYRSRDNLPVILKVLNEAYPSPERLAWFRHEYEVTVALNDVPGVITAYALEMNQQHRVMVLEDFGGAPLNQLPLQGTMLLPDFLTLAIAVADILSQVHQRHIIHKDINPSNIVFNTMTGQVKLIDFGISTILSRETPTFSNSNVLEGTLSYMSPEQTGRMKRVLGSVKE